MPKLRPLKRIRLGGTAEVGMAAGAPGVQLDIVQVTPEDNAGWSFAVMRGRRQIGALGQWPDGWF